VSVNLARIPRFSRVGRSVARVEESRIRMEEEEENTAATDT
jgi:hypothetical protein